MSDLNCPEGATHYLQAGEEETRFRDLSGEQWKYFNSYTGKWVQHYFSSEDLLLRHDLIARPKTKTWSGPEDGLPPVGMDVLIEGRNEPVKVVGHVRENELVGIITQGADDWFYSHTDQVFSIKTPEQQAADKRESAIADMAKFLPGAKHECWTVNPDGSVRPYAHVYEILGLLVDAGFKREVV